MNVWLSVHKFASMSGVNSTHMGNIINYTLFLISTICYHEDIQV